MKKHIDFQVIEQNLDPVFAVVPYKDFMQLIGKQNTILQFITKRVDEEDISKIRAWREYNGLTQRAVAKTLGITQPAFHQIEQSEKPHLKTVEKVAKALDLTVEQLS